MESEWDKEPVSTPTLERREDPSPSKIMCVMGVGVGRHKLRYNFFLSFAMKNKSYTEKPKMPSS